MGAATIGGAGVRPERRWWPTAEQLQAASLCYRCAQRGVASYAAVQCVFCHAWVCLRCHDAIAGICRTCAAPDIDAEREANR